MWQGIAALHRERLFPFGGAPLDSFDPPLRPVEIELLRRLREDWAVPFGSRNLGLTVDYRHGVIVGVAILYAVAHERFTGPVEKPSTRTAGQGA